MEKNNHIPIFLSFSKPVFPAQQEFIQNLSDGIEKFGMRPRTLGVTDYDIGVPLIAIKTLMSNSAGLISVAFRRTHIETGDKFDTSDGRAGRKEPIRDKWLTSPWPHVESPSLVIDTSIASDRTADRSWHGLSNRFTNPDIERVGCGS